MHPELDEAVWISCKNCDGNGTVVVDGDVDLCPRCKGDEGWYSTAYGGPIPEPDEHGYRYG